MGILFDLQGRHQEALEHVQQALAYCQEALGLHRSMGNESAEGSTWDSLGHAHHHLGHYEQAIECYHQALDPFGKTRQRYFLADTLSHLGDTCYAIGDYEAARDLGASPDHLRRPATPGRREGLPETQRPGRNGLSGVTLAFAKSAARDRRRGPR
jgi:tetratricopeptide (TPR) repeat protein